MRALTKSEFNYLRGVENGTQEAYYNEIYYDEIIISSVAVEDDNGVYGGYVLTRSPQETIPENNFYLDIYLRNVDKVIIFFGLADSVLLYLNQPKIRGIVRKVSTVYELVKLKITGVYEAALPEWVVSTEECERVCFEWVRPV